jgi:hypothetical protein
VDSHRVPRAPCYSGAYWLAQTFVYGAVTLYGVMFQSLPLAVTIPLCRSHNPGSACRTGLGSPLFARRYWGVLFDFSSSGYLDVSVPRVPSSRPMCSSVGGWVLTQPGFPIRISPDQSLLAAPRSVSPLVASFVGTMPLGIHHVLSVTYFKRILGEDSMVPICFTMQLSRCSAASFRRHETRLSSRVRRRVILPARSADVNRARSFC